MNQLPPDPKLRAALLEELANFVTDNKRGKMAKVLDMRTRQVTIVLEDIYQSQNASATLRTADCMGLQDIYIIENYNDYQLNPEVSLGASKWLDLHRFNEAEANNTEICFKHLREKGFRIVGTSLAADSLHPADLPLEQPLALVFGNEEYGLSEYAQQHTDLNIKIPMYGFTQSFNISVSVAISLSHVVEALHRSELAWQLSDAEKQEILLRWYKKVGDRRGIITRQFFDKRKKE
jgi:tRNA (guanosine-2'-O-)-methyltransferase